MMRTQVLSIEDKEALERGAALLRAGELVAFPTETVYGLGADALSESAVRKIFEAKGRPGDNPLIVHIACSGEVDRLCMEVPETARLLMRRFWPGPLTLVMKKKDAVPLAVTAGLSTVAVRMPDHAGALELIRRSGVPVAAPSANRSGRPSPTTARSVLEDMRGRIPLILDGGESRVGVESTVLDMTKKVPVILRPGGVTREMLKEVLGEVAVHPAVMAPLEDAPAASPGMKYRHYAPRAHVTVVQGPRGLQQEHICRRYDQCEKAGERVVIFCDAQTAADYGGRQKRVWGSGAEDAAHTLYAMLRSADEEGFGHVFCEALESSGMGLAVMNRLLRAASFDVEVAKPE
ncbi:MAG: L-threonylcarbamoyladenylate synthase [Christensenellales bacterium]|jgi:L-threonylcarbamoyladenylate synthase